MHVTEEKILTLLQEMYGVGDATLLPLAQEEGITGNKYQFTAVNLGQLMIQITPVRGTYGRGKLNTFHAFLVWEPKPPNLDRVLLAAYSWNAVTEELDSIPLTTRHVLLDKKTKVSSRGAVTGRLSSWDSFRCPFKD